MNRRNFLKVSGITLGFTSFSGCLEPISENINENANYTFSITRTRISTPSELDLDFGINTIDSVSNHQTPPRIEISLLNNSHNDYIIENTVSGELLDSRESEESDIVLMKSSEWSNENIKKYGECYQLNEEIAYPTATSQTSINSQETLTNQYDVLLHPNGDKCVDTGIYTNESFLTVVHQEGQAYEGDIEVTIELQIERKEI